MSFFDNAVSRPATGNAGETIHVQLSKADVALIIDALLQAEMTLPLIDRRYRAMKAIDALRANQLSLANRLEELMSDTVNELNKAKSPPAATGAGHPTVKWRREGDDT